MRTPIALILMIGALVVDGAAIAATTPAATAQAPPNPPAGAQKAGATRMSPSPAKRAACERIWRAQTRHTGKHKAFIAACVAKG